MIIVTQLFVEPKVVGVTDTFEKAEGVVQDYFKQIGLSIFFRWDRRNTQSQRPKTITFQPSQKQKNKFSGTIQLKELVCVPDLSLARSHTSIVGELKKVRAQEMVRRVN